MEQSVGVHVSLCPDYFWIKSFNLTQPGSSAKVLVCYNQSVLILPNTLAYFIS